jgi:hypothetical protein
MTIPVRPVHGGPWGCWTPERKTHPWYPDVVDVACGYDLRLADRRCAGCWRCRAESPTDQLRARQGLGDAA